MCWCCQQGQAGSETSLQQNPPVFNWLFKLILIQTQKKSQQGNWLNPVTPVADHKTFLFSFY